MIIEKITEEELEFMESWFTPRCLIECLFNDADNLSEFNEDEFLEIRNYQFPMISNEYIIDEKMEGLNKKEQFQLRKGAGDIYCLGARKYGKCESQESWCLLATGQYKQYKDLIGTSQEVFSLNNSTLKIEKSLATFYDNGYKDCLKITLKSGKEITVTKNHPLLTGEDWKIASELNLKDFIATPRKINISKTKLINPNKAKLLGYLLGDGGCTQKTVRFSNINQELITEIRKIADYYNCSLKKYGIDYIFVNKVHKLYKKNLITKFVEDFRINKLSKNKEIPEEVFQWSEKSIAIMLNRLFACDGHINLHNNTIEIVLASKKLIYQIGSLLLRFGIHSWIDYKQSKCEKKHFNAWRLMIAQDFDKFLNIIGIKSKDNNFRKNKIYSTSDRIPNQLFLKNYKLFSGYKKIWKLRNMKHYNSSRKKWQKIAKVINAPEINKIAFSDIYWEQIKKIENVGKLSTVAVSVSKNANYISNNIFSHNTKCVEELDLLLSMLYLDGEESGFSSIDAIHIRGVLEKTIQVLENHPIISLWKQKINRSPDFRFNLRNGHVVTSVNMNLNSRNPGCVDKKTEILTDSGWKYFKDLNYSDKVLSLDTKTQKAKYCSIDKIIKQKYNGSLKKLKSRTSEFLLTPNHSLLLYYNKKFQFKKIEENLPKQIYCPTTFKWVGKNKKTITLKGISNFRKKEISFDMENWIQFIAWYLSEGTLSSCLGHYRIKIGQKNNLVELETLLKRLNINYYKQFDKCSNIHVLTISNKLIYRHLKQYFGEKKNKHIANYVKQLNGKYLRKFIDAYLKGDGNIYLQSGKYEAKCIFTSVKVLADDLQEIAQKAGYKTHLKEKITDCFIKNYKMYFIQLCRSKSTVFKKSLIEDVPYNDYVYCVDTKPYHNIFIRRNGCVMWTGNSQFFQKHLKRLYIEEASFEPEEVYKKRKEAQSEFGCVFRISGMTNFTKYSPPGRAFYDLENKPKVLNLPQYVNPYWDEKEKEDRIKEYGGENTIGYRVFVKGEVVEDGISAFDMERIRKNCYPSDKRKIYIKNFEVTKDNFTQFENIIVVERPKNADRIFINADIGESAGSEIIIHSKVGEKYRYLYNITLFNLTDKEQFKVFRFLINSLQAEVVGLDCGDGSIDKDEFVLLKVNNNLQYCKAKNLEAFFENNKNIKIPTWKQGKLEYKHGSVYKHKYTGKMMKFYINPSSGYVRVTPNHSMMVYTSKGIQIIQANELKVNDWVVSPKIQNINHQYKQIKYASKKIKLDEELGYFLGWCVAEGCSKTTNYQLTLGNELAHANNLLNLSRKILNIKTGYINKNNRINKTNNGIFKGKKRKYNVPTYSVILGGGKKVLKFYEGLVGKGAHNKRIPIEILNSPISVQKSFLNGLLEGDGHIRQRKSKEYTIKVVSEELIYGIGLLLKQLNVFPTFNIVKEHGLTSYSISWTDKQLEGRWKGVPYQVIPLKNGKSREHKKVYNLKNLIKNRVSKRKLDKIKELLSYNFYFRKVSKIETYNYNDYVYDLMVEDNNTFIAGMGDILVHNTGRAIYRSIEEAFKNIILIWYDGSKKVIIDYEKDDKNKIIFKNGKPVTKEERMAQWSVKRLRDILYEGKVFVPIDYKFDMQFNSVIGVQTTAGTNYHCMTENNHEFDAWKVFAIAEWIVNFGNKKLPQTSNWGLGV